MSNETNQGAVIEIHSVTDDMGKVRRGSCSLFLVISKKWQNQMKLRDYMSKTGDIFYPTLLLFEPCI